MRRPLTALAALLLSASTIPAAHAATTVTTKLACTKGGVTSSASAVMGANTKTHALASDYTWSASSVQAISLRKTVTITKAGNYRLTGTMANGQVIVNVNGNGVVRLILANANITSKTGAAIEVKAAAKVVVMLQAGTRNALTDAANRSAKDSASAALYSKAPLSIAGTGTLNVNGKYNDAIGGTDGVVIAGGSITLDAKDDGIRGKDFVSVDGANLTITAIGDGIRSAGTKASTVGYVYIGSGTVSINAKMDAVQGISDVVIAGGTIKIIAGDDAFASSCVTYIEKADITISATDDAIHSDGESVIRSGTIDITKAYEGVEGAAVAISGGTVHMVTSDDGLNTAGGVDSSGTMGPGQQQTTPKATVFSNSLSNHLQIDGGTIVINAMGDGIDINGSAEVTGGKLIVSGPTANDNGALDVDTTFNVTGGMIIAVGSSGMAVGPSLTSSQAAVLGNFTSSQAAGSIVHITDADGKVLASFKSPKAYQSIVFTSADIVKGKTYKVYVGGTVSGTAVGAYYANGSIAGATLYGTLTGGSYTNQGPGGGGRPRP